MKDLHKDFKLPKLETEEEIENFLKRGIAENPKNSFFDFYNKSNGLLNLNESSLSDIKSVLNGVSQDKIILIQKEMAKKLNHSDKLLSSSKNFTIASIILFALLIFFIAMAGSGLGTSVGIMPEKISLFLYVVSFFSFIFTSIASVVQFFRSLLNYMGTYGESSLLGFKYNIKTWIVSIFLLFLLFPPFALLFGYFFKSDFKSHLNKYFISNNMPTVEEIERNLDIEKNLK